jgi:chromosome segregation ATPase
MPNEAQINADIEAVRERVSETQELYREVCATLFFRHGVTPTANKLYQYVRKGSMSAPAAALAKFWEDLREKSRVRIEHPDLPETLKSAAGEMVAALWSQARQAAREDFAAFRSEAQAAVLETRSALSATEKERADALAELDEVRRTVEAATERSLQLERGLAAERAGKAALVLQLETTERQQSALESALTENRREFAAELEKLREALLRSEERCEATEKRALLEIDRERTAAAKWQKDWVQVRHEQQESEERHRAERGGLQADLGDARQKLGEAEGTLQEIRLTLKSQADELQSLRKAVADGESRKILLEHDLAACREDAEKLALEWQQRLAAQAATTKTANPRRRSLKPA